MVALTRRRAMVVCLCLLAGWCRILLAQASLMGCVSEPDIGKAVGLITSFRQKGESKSYGSLELVRRTIRRAIPERLRAKGYEVIVVDTTGLPVEAGKLTRGKVATMIALQHLTALVVVEFEFREDRTLWTTDRKAPAPGRPVSYKKYDAKQPYPQATREEWVYGQDGAVQCHVTAATQAGWVAERAVQAPGYEALMDQLIALKVPLLVKPIERWARELAADPGVLNAVPRYAADSAGLMFASISAGMDHVCALTPAGTAYCWGSNSDGQLGGPVLDTCAEITPSFIAPRSTPCSPSPVPVAGGLTFKSIQAGDGVTCGLTRTGDAYCWGYNADGRLGDGTTTRRDIPARVVGDVQFDSLYLRAGNACGLTTAGAAYCWGTNAFGQLGDGTTTRRPSPVGVTGDLQFKALYMEGNYTCGLTPAGAALCWGYNKLGQIGDSTRIDRPTPVPVKGGLTFATLVVDFLGPCGLTTAGSAYCWGGMTVGQVEGQFSSSVPLRVGQGPFAALAVRLGETCGLGLDGVGYCWWRGGNPQSLPGGILLRSIFLSPDRTRVCGLAQASEDRYCWIQGGTSGTWQQMRSGPRLGGSEVQFTSPTHGGGIVVEGWAIDKDGLERIEYRKYRVASDFTCGVTGSGAGYCWGTNQFGQLGDRTKTPREAPVRVR